MLAGRPAAKVPAGDNDIAFLCQPCKVIACPFKRVPCKFLLIVDGEEPSRDDRIGVYIVWDKKIDFLKEVLVSPMSRTAIFIGKIVGGSTDTLLQSLILLVVGYAFVSTGIMTGIVFSPVSIAIALAFLLMTTVGLVSIGLIIGSQMESPEGFQLIGSFLIFPMFFLSGALFPIENLPVWLAPFVLVNPAFKFAVVFLFYLVVTSVILKH
jgi:ABC-type multidrug transport system permease subunit